jgi:uncharacterized protein YabN with tetrapyrrole methylase and pyrophosphatase domain
MPAGSLTIVGTGIRLSQLSAEARGAIENAEKLLFLVCDPVTYAWLTQVNAEAESLHTLYDANKPRYASYAGMVERMLSCVRQGSDVCVAFYGHPGVAVDPGHEAIRRAGLEGYSAKMIPGISAEDCLFADLGIDPATDGWQSFEATDFLVYRRQFDPCVPLALWQAGITGDPGYDTEDGGRGLRILVEVLLERYSSAHEVVIYEASRYLGCPPSIQRVPLAGVPDVGVAVSATLYIPPVEQAKPDLAMAERLGVSRFYRVGGWGAPAPGDGR